MRELQPRRVLTVAPMPPEKCAYALARYSRSPDSIRQSLEWVRTHDSQKFLESFYFQYGHRSIADLAHLAFAIERLSLLAAIAVVDEQRWDGQERSTRYQDFKKSGYHVPDFAPDAPAAALYRDLLDALFREYESVSQLMWEYLQSRVPLREGMRTEDYERTLRARAFDIARYLLPLATNTSLGQIVSARTLENQIARLLSHTHPEVRALGEKLKHAAREPAFNPADIRYRELVEDAKAYDDLWAKQLKYDIVKSVCAAPMLVKYADPNPYEMETRRDLGQAATDLMRGAAIGPAREARVGARVARQPRDTADAGGARQHGQPGARHAAGVAGARAPGFRLHANRFTPRDKE